jgi:hypothetical protein
MWSNMLVSSSTVYTLIDVIITAMCRHVNTMFGQCVHVAYEKLWASWLRFIQSSQFFVSHFIVLTEEKRLYTRRTHKMTKML